MSDGGRWRLPDARPAEGAWRAGNRVELLENGEEFFARAFAAIGEARTEILIETFILFEDKVGNELHRLLVEAARRGVPSTTSSLRCRRRNTLVRTPSRVGCWSYARKRTPASASAARKPSENDGEP